MVDSRPAQLRIGFEEGLGKLLRLVRTPRALEAVLAEDLAALLHQPGGPLGPGEVHKGPEFLRREDLQHTLLPHVPGRVGIARGVEFPEGRRQARRDDHMGCTPLLGGGRLGIKRRQARGIARGDVGSPRSGGTSRLGGKRPRRQQAGKEDDKALGGGDCACRSEVAAVGNGEGFHCLGNDALPGECLVCGTAKKRAFAGPVKAGKKSTGEAGPGQSQAVMARGRRAAARASRASAGPS